MKKRILSTCMAVMMMLANFAGCAENNNAEKAVQSEIGGNQVQLSENDEYTLCAQSGNISLYVNGQTGVFYVENQQDGSVWYSSPLDAREDSYANRPVQNQMLSNLLISYKDIETGEASVANTAVGADTSIYRLENGVKYVYHFDELSASVIFEISLENDALVTELDTEEIEFENENIKISEVSILPYFCSGSETDEGYLVVGDGSGALINFRNDKQSCESYKRRIYGEEPTDETREFSLLTQNEGVRLPVCGVKRGNSAMLVVGEDGAENGFLNANTNYKYSSYANAYMSYKLIDSMSYSLGSLESTIYDKKGMTIPLIKQKYYFLSGEDADYSGMARKYGEYLKNQFSQKTLSKTDTRLYVDIYAGVAKQQSHFGIITNDIVPLTTTKQTKMILDSLKDSGINAYTRYLSWNSDELKQNALSSVKISSAISKGLSLKQLCDQYDVLPAIANTQIYYSGNFISNLTSASFSLMALPYKWNGHSISTLTENDESYYRLSANKLSKYGGKIVNSYAKQGLKKAAFEDIGNKLYTDYRGEHQYRRDIMNIELEILKSAEEVTDMLALSSPNAYAAGYADIIFDTPINHSNHALLDESIPFYSIALSNVSECVAPAFNNNNIGKDIVLYSISFGCAPCYAWIYENASSLIGTTLSNLSNVNYNSTIEEAEENYNIFVDLGEKSDGSEIYSHKYINSLLTETTYENGLKVYVNFSDEEQSIGDGSYVSARSYLTVLP